MLPVAAPAIAAAVIFAAILSWNDYLLGLNLTSGPEAAPLTVGIGTYIQPFNVRYGEMTAAGTLAGLPIVLLAAFGAPLHRHWSHGRGGQMTDARAVARVCTQEVPARRGPALTPDAGEPPAAHAALTRRLGEGAPGEGRPDCDRRLGTVARAITLGSVEVDPAAGVRGTT